MEKILFYILATLTLASAVFVASTKNLVRSVFMFFVTLFSLAGLYVLSLADFVAITQIVVYVGGILVLILFAFMLSGRQNLAALQEQSNKVFSVNKLIGGVVAILFFIVIVNVVLKTDADHLPWIEKSISYKTVVQPASNMTENIGMNLMTRYLLPFEALSILLLMALVGAAHLSRKGGTE